MDAHVGGRAMSADGEVGGTSAFEVSAKVAASAIKKL
jgi:hypothetical protein